MLLENRHYKLQLVGSAWECKQVSGDECNRDFVRAKADGSPIWFTIRRFTNNVGFLLYLEIDNKHFLERQANFMSKHPAP